MCRSCGALLTVLRRGCCELLTQLFYAGEVGGVAGLSGLLLLFAQCSCQVTVGLSHRTAGRFHRVVARILQMHVSRRGLGSTGLALQLFDLPLEARLALARLGQLCAFLLGARCVCTKLSCTDQRAARSQSV